MNELLKEWYEATYKGKYSDDVVVDPAVMKKWLAYLISSNPTEPKPPSMSDFMERMQELSYDEK